MAKCGGPVEVFGSVTVRARVGAPINFPVLLPKLFNLGQSRFIV